jgi:hypothetical protein
VSAPEGLAAPPLPVRDPLTGRVLTPDDLSRVRAGLRELKSEATLLLGERPDSLREVAQIPEGKRLGRLLTERQWRLVRYALALTLGALTERDQQAARLSAAVLAIHAHFSACPLCDEDVCEEGLALFHEECLATAAYRAAEASAALG